MKIFTEDLVTEKAFKPFKVVLEFETIEDVLKYKNDLDLIKHGYDIVGYEKVNTEGYSKVINQLTYEIKQRAGEL